MCHTTLQALNARGCVANGQIREVVQEVGLIFCPIRSARFSQVEEEIQRRRKAGAELKERCWRIKKTCM